MIRNVTLAISLAVASASPLAARQSAGALQAGLRVARLVAQPTEIRVVAGQTVALSIRALDASGNAVSDAQLRVVGPRSGDGAVRATADSVTGVTAGQSTIIVTTVLPPDAGREPTRLEIPVIVSWPAISRIEVAPDRPATLYAGTTLRHHASAWHADGTERPRAEFAWTTSNPAVATVDRFGNVTAVDAGEVDLSARIEGNAGTLHYSVRPFTGSSLSLGVSAASVRTGDVVTLSASVATPGGAIGDAPTDFTYTFTPDDSIHAPGAPGLIRGDRFVGEVPGQYIITAYVGNLTARTAIDVRPRRVVRDVQVIGHGAVRDVHTSDLWVFQGVDGRDYAITGTWSADGWAYFWDVTDPSKIVKTDSVHIDARTVNDVKVAPNGRWAALSREGASNRRNGVVILDLAVPAHPRIASTYDEGLTGGVHNMFATNDHLFALSAGDKYMILDVRDPASPKFVSEYNHPDSRIHDVWVYDGLAYSSEWQSGVVVVDVGNGKWGGSIEKPKFVTAIPYPVGRTHAAFPYYQRSTGKVYLFLGDEIIGRGEGAAWQGVPNAGEKGGTPEVTSGYYHVIDATDPMHPQDVARYEVQEFGTHNLWVEDDILFAAYYEGGVRMVDVSGELLGNLADQDREIAVYKSYDPNGFVANAAMVWGAQPYKGNVFLADHYSGLWAVRMVPRNRQGS